jgi:hypothetical protein
MVFMSSKRTNSLEDFETPGRPLSYRTDEKVKKWRQAFNEDRSHTINNVCNIMGLSCGTCPYILTKDCNIRLTFANFVPRLLSEDLEKHKFMCAKP